MTVTNTAIPTITGTAKVGQTLHSSNGTWTFDLDYLSYAYQWMRCDAAGANCVAIPTANAANYIPVSADVGNTLRSQVTATEHSNPPPGNYIDQITDFRSIFLPISTSSGSVQQGVTNPPGLGGGVWEISDVDGVGFRFVATTSMVAPWQNNKKVCFGQLPIRPAVGAYEEWSFKYRYPTADNPSMPHSWQGGTIFEFGHTATNSGLFIGLDGRNVSGDLGHILGVGKPPWGVGDFDYYTICSYSTFIATLGQDRLVEARIRYNADNTGYVQVKIDGVTIIDASRPMRPNTSEIPLPQPGWYSDIGTTKNGVEIRNLQYNYNV